MLKRYGIIGALRLIISVIYTKIFFPKARLIRVPFDIRNKRHINIGKNFTTGFGCRIEAHPLSQQAEICIFFGENVQINDYVHIAAGENIFIGNNVLIASKVFITDINHGQYQGLNSDNPFTPPNSRPLSTSPVKIEDNVWIGENVCIMPGTTIGFGSIVGASAVVTKNIPPHAIVAGNPAKVIKIYNTESQMWERVKN